MSGTTCEVENCTAERLPGSAYCPVHTGQPTKLSSAPRPSVQQDVPPAVRGLRNPANRQGAIMLLAVVVVGVIIVVVRLYHGHGTGQGTSAADSYYSVQDNPGGGGNANAPAGPNTQADPAAKLLAQRDGSSDVATYSAALDAWAADCTETRTDAAGIVDATYSDEQEHAGPDGSRLAVMRHLTKSVPASQAPTNCASVAAAYLVLVEK